MGRGRRSHVDFRFWILDCGLKNYSPIAKLAGLF